MDVHLAQNIQKAVSVEGYLPVCSSPALSIGEVLSDVTMELQWDKWQPYYKVLMRDIARIMSFIEQMFLFLSERTKRKNGKCYRELY
jgi:hypothetical protein